jgi:hypothetical protein
MAKRPNLSTMTFHESYGSLPTHILRMCKRFNIPPAEYDMLLVKFGEVVTDWDAMYDYIAENVNPNNGMFYMPLGAL